MAPPAFFSTLDALPSSTCTTGDSNAHTTHGESQPERRIRKQLQRAAQHARAWREFPSGSSARARNTQAAEAIQQQAETLSGEAKKATGTLEGPDSHRADARGELERGDRLGHVRHVGRNLHEPAQAQQGQSQDSKDQPAGGDLQCDGEDRQRASREAAQRHAAGQQCSPHNHRASIRTHDARKHGQNEAMRAETAKERPHMSVLLFFSSESCSRCVSTLLRYGTCACLFAAQVRINAQADEQIEIEWRACNAIKSIAASSRVQNTIQKLWQCAGQQRHTQMERTEGEFTEQSMRRLTARGDDIAQRRQRKIDGLRLRHALARHACTPGQEIVIKSESVKPRAKIVAIAACEASGGNAVQLLQRRGEYRSGQRAPSRPDRSARRHTE